MQINPEQCKKCGECVPECANKAISKNNEDNYVIDQSLCNNCANFSDIECIRVCNFSAITRDDKTVPEIDRTWRLLSNHLPWMIAIMGERGNTPIFPVNHSEYKAFRKLIAAAFSDPGLKVRVVYGFDDICTSCPRKQEGCGEAPGGIGFERLGIEPGTIIRLWDLIQLFEDKYSIPFLKQYGYKDDFIGWICTFVSPKAKMLTNEY